MSRTWDTARICLNGHVLTEHLEKNPDVGDFCKKCGAKAISTCSYCDAPIQGLPSNVFGLFPAPEYCHECGEAYPWKGKIGEITKKPLSKWIYRSSLLYWLIIARKQNIVNFKLVT